MLRRKSSKTEEKAKKVEKAPKAEKTLSTPAPVYRKAKPDIYTIFLAIALVAVLVGILFLYLELQAYDFKHQGGPPVAVRGQDSGAAGSWLAVNAISRFNA